MSIVAELPNFLADRLADAETGWSIGTFGAIAEFSRDADEATTLDCGSGMISAVTERGALRVQAHPELRPVASESLTSEGWSHRVALCLPRDGCGMSGRKVLTEIGPDRAALRPGDRRDILFDLGLGALQVDVCIRSSDPAVTAKLRESAGKSVFAPDSSAMGVIVAGSPHRVFISRLGRIEVFQPIPPANGKSPSGPHTHVLPKLLAHGRTHAATEPLPDGWIPCAHVYPPNPIRDQFGRQRAFQLEHHSAFQSLLTRFGDPKLLAIKQRVVKSIAAGDQASALSMANDRSGRTAVRVTLRQLQASGQPSSVLAAWLSLHDGGEPGEAVDTADAHH